MVGGLFQHLKSLRLISDDKGWIKALLDEAENERIHLLVYSEIAKPNILERTLIMIVQFFFYNIYFVLYLLSPRTAHRVVGYFEEEAIHSYEHYLRLVHDGVHENIPATPLAKSYWNLDSQARLADIIVATIKDEMIHRDVNHAFADDPHGASHFR
jgi:ubiquinol oxidase